MKKEYIYAAISIFCWSTAATVSKLLLGSLDSMQILFVSSLVATVFLLFLNIAKGTLKKIRALSALDFLKLFVIGTLGIFLYHLFLYMGIDRMDASQAFIINYLWPIMSVIFACIILKEKMTARRAIAIVLSFLGVIIVTTGGNFSSLAIESISGSLLCVLAAVCFGLYTALNKRESFDQLLSMLVFYFFSTVAAFIYCVMTKASFAFSPAEIGGLLWIGIFTTAVPYVTWALALESGDTAKVSNLAYITPFLSLVWTTLILREDFKITSLIGLAVIISGVLLQLGGKKKN